MLNTIGPIRIFKLIHHVIAIRFFPLLVSQFCYTFVTHSRFCFFKFSTFVIQTLAIESKGVKFFVILYLKCLGVFILTKDLSSLVRMLINRACRAVENF